MLLNLAWVRFSLLLLVWGVSLGPQGAIAQISKEVAPSTVPAQAELSDRLLQQAVQQFRQADYLAAEVSLKQALSLYRQSKNRTGEAQALTQLSEVYGWMSRWEAGLEASSASLALWRELKNRAGEAEALTWLAEAHFIKGDQAKSLEILQQALSLRREVNDRAGEGKTLVSLGAITYKNGQPQKALEMLQEAQAILQKEDRFQESLALGWLGFVQFNQGDKARGSATLGTALKLSRETSHRAAEFSVLFFIAETHFQKKEYAKALNFYQQSWSIVLRMGNKNSERIILKAIANMHRNLKQFEGAQKSYQQALIVYREAVQKGFLQADRDWEADTLWSIANMLYEQNQHSTALSFYQQAGEIYRSLKQSPGGSDKQNIARRNEVGVLKGIASVYQRQSQLSQALNVYQQALNTLRESDQNRDEEAGILIGIGQMYDKQADSIKAMEAYQEVIKLTEGLQGVELWKRLAFSSIGGIYRSQGKYIQALEAYQKERAIAREMKDEEAEQSAIQSILTTYEGMGIAHSVGRRYAAALEALQTGLKLAREAQQKPHEARALRYIGSVHYNQNEQRQALKYFQQSLAIETELKSDADVATTLWYSGLAYYALSQYPEALEALQQASQIHEKQGDRAQKIGVLFRIGDVYSAQGKYRQAREIQQQALAFYQRVVPRFQNPITAQNLDATCDPSNQFDEGDFLFNHVRRLCQERQQLGDGSAAAMLENLRKTFLKGNLKGEAIALGAVAGTYVSVGQYDIAINYRQRAMQTFQNIDAPREVASSLLSLAGIYKRKGDFARAIALTQQALEISRKLEERSYTAWAFWSLADIYVTWGRYAESLEFNQKSLAIYRSIEDTSSEADVLNAMGMAYGRQSQYAQERDYYQQALALRQKLGDRPGVAVGLANLGGSHRALGQYSQSLESYQKALNLVRELGDRSTEAVVLNRIGRTYFALKQYDKALDSQLQSLEINRKIESRINQIMTLQDMGRIYDARGQFQQAATYLQQSLTLSQESGVRSEEVRIRNLLGRNQLNLGQFAAAADSLQQGLLIAQETGDREAEARILSNLGELFTKQNQPELAIVFYKQSVSVFEIIRQGIRKLDRDQQESYTQIIADTYRALADLLLKQNRILEAQQALDLLKVQELNDYLTNVRGEGKALTVLQPETEILKKYGELQKSAIELGKEFTQLEDLARTGTLTPTQRDRKNQLLKLQEELTQQFNQFTQRSDVVALTSQLTPKAIQQGVNLDQLDSLRDELRRLNAVMIYPVILDDRLELIITTPDSPPLRRTTQVKREDLNRAIAEFRQALQDPTQDAKPIAQKLYAWMIQPLEADLKQANAKTLIYAPDAQLRYIPIAALHDGQQWLVQRFRINNITSQSLTNFTAKPQTRSRVLAGASAAAREVTVGNKRQTFKALPFAAQEVNNVATLVPNTTKLIDQDFSLDGFTAQMNEYAIVHFATHASFVPEDPTQSFILFGDGKTANLQQIGNWTLKDVDLVVLSACETAVGIQALGSKALGRGEEILGLGYQFQTRGAKATIASLWSVDDGGTQALISAFYQQLQSGKLTKAEALQQAQIALLNIKTKAAPLPSDRAVVQPETPNQTTRNDRVSPGYSHPYYWAPFILIGNGL